MCEICSKLAIKTRERLHCRDFDTFEEISHIIMVLPMLTLNQYVLTGFLYWDWEGRSCKIEAVSSTILNVSNKSAGKTCSKL